MLDPRYGPGRRRKPMVALMLDWAAGVLVGIVAIMLGYGLVMLLVEPAHEQLAALMRMAAVAGPLGVALGVWLSTGRPLTARALVCALGLTVIGVGLVLSPYWLDSEIEPVRTLSAIAAVLSAPVFARLGVGLARKHAGS